MTDAVCCDKWDVAKKSSILFDIKLTEEKIERERKVLENAISAAQDLKEHVANLRHELSLLILSKTNTLKYECHKKDLSLRIQQQEKTLKFRLSNIGNLCLELDSYEKRLANLKQQIAE